MAQDAQKLYGNDSQGDWGKVGGHGFNRNAACRPIATMLCDFCPHNGCGPTKQTSTTQGRRVESDGYSA